MNLRLWLHTKCTCVSLAPYATEYLVWVYFCWICCPFYKACLLEIVQKSVIIISLIFLNRCYLCTSVRVEVSLLHAGGGGVSKEICGSVRLPVWRYVSHQRLSKWRAKCSSKRQIKISNLSRKYCSDFFVLFLNETSSGLMNFKDSFLSSNKLYGKSYWPVTLLRASAQQDWGI